YDDQQRDANLMTDSFGRKDRLLCITCNFPLGDNVALVLEDIELYKVSKSNSIWKEGAKAIAEALKISSTLTSLDMGHSSTSEEGAKALVEELKMNLTLTTLAIGIHTITKEVVQAV
ncbi:unnamed protein product, partial [Didymodactylos carnosus]